LPPLYIIKKKKEGMTHPLFWFIYNLSFFIYSLRPIEFTKFTVIEQILNTEVHVGSIENLTEKQWVFNHNEEKLEYREITYVPAFLKIFDEILVNAADNKVLFD
jgi:hypothetical protein